MRVAFCPGPAGNPLQAAALADGTVTEPGVAATSVQTSPNSSEDAVEDKATSINIQDGRVGTCNIFLKSCRSHVDTDVHF